MSERPRVRRPRKVGTPLETKLESHSKAAPEIASEPAFSAIPAATTRVADTSGPVTADTPMRSIGDVPLSVWRAELARLDSPMLAEVEEIARAASPHGALALTGTWWIDGDRYCVDVPATDEIGGCFDAVLDGSDLRLYEPDGTMSIRFTIARPEL